MRLTLSRCGTSAVRATLDLARYPLELRKRSVLAAATGVPLATLTAALVRLRRAGLVEAAPGPSGGYRLSRAPDEITVLEVIEAAEGELRARTCVLRGVPCDGSCSFHWVWRGAQEELLRRLGTTTLRDIAGPRS